MHRRTNPAKVVIALTLALSLMVVRRYGIIALATGKRARHAAIGRARGSLLYANLHSGARIGNHTARDLINHLRRERQAAALATYGM